jgi:hypothetical protein
MTTLIAVSLRDFREVKETKMKNTTLADMPEHRCAKPENPSFGFAPLDLEVTKAMIDRGASSAEVYAQVKVWIEADSTKNPNPTEPEFERFKAALHANVPFAVYCRQCLEVVCLIHPEEMKDYDVQN